MTLSNMSKHAAYQALCVIASNKRLQQHCLVSQHAYRPLHLQMRGSKASHTYLAHHELESVIIVVIIVIITIIVIIIIASCRYFWRPASFKPIVNQEGPSQQFTTAGLACFYTCPW